MVQYNCEICGKQFKNQKSHYIKHINRKFPCGSKIIEQENMNIDVNEQIQICTIIKPDEQAQTQIEIETDTENKYEIDVENKNKCEFCNKNFTRETSLK
jgi:DNA-directed RNA polymerase subunit RPC12/RpoP